VLAEHGRGRRRDQCPIEIEHGERTARHRRGAYLGPITPVPVT
jgi:hypothetical protein